MRNQSNWGNWNWEDFMHTFKQAFPDGFAQVENFVKRTVDEVLSGNPVVHNYGFSLQHDIFETHDYMIVKIPLPKHVDLHSIRLFFDTNVLKIVGLSEKTEWIQLPTNGRFTGSQAYCKEGWLEIRIPKKEKENFREIMIKHL